jgi:chromosomal replication initiation ATPase DnaA
MVTAIESKEIKAEAIINLIDKYFSLNCRDLDRGGNKVIARQMAMYYIKKYINLTYTKIGKLFPSKDSAAGYKGHDTVLYAFRTVEGLVEVDKETKSYDRDLSKEVDLIAKLNINEITQYKIRTDIFEKLKQLSESQLNDVNLNLDAYLLK